MGPASHLQREAGTASFEADRRVRMVSYYQRRFDGVARRPRSRPLWHVTAAAFMPTQGGYEESTNLSMPKVQVAGLADREAATAEWQAFGRLPRSPRHKGGRRQHFSLDRPVDVTVGDGRRSYARVAPPARRGSTWSCGAPPSPATGTAALIGRRSVAVEAGYRWTGVRRGRGCAPATCGRRAMADGEDIATARSSRCCPRRGSTRCRRRTRR